MELALDSVQVETISFCLVFLYLHCTFAQGASVSTKADEIEEQLSRQKVDFSDGLIGDKNAVLIASGDRQSLGQIVKCDDFPFTESSHRYVFFSSVNMGTSRLLGISMSELVGSNLTSIMPLPYTIYHTVCVGLICFVVLRNSILLLLQSWLIAYNATGKSAIVNATPRCVFVLHRSGYMVI